MSRAEIRSSTGNMFLDRHIRIAKTNKCYCTAFLGQHSRLFRSAGRAFWAIITREFFSSIFHNRSSYLQVPAILILGVDCFQTPEILIQVIASFQVPDILIQNLLAGEDPWFERRVRSIPIAECGVGRAWFAFSERRRRGG